MNFWDTNVYSAYAEMNDKNNLSRIIRSWRRTYEYYWSRGQIIFPLPIQETVSRKKITISAQQFMSKM